MNLDLVVRGPIRANGQRLIFPLFKSTFTDKVSLVLKASIHQIVEKKD